MGSGQMPLRSRMRRRWSLGRWGRRLLFPAVQVGGQSIRASKSTLRYHHWDGVNRLRHTFRRGPRDSERPARFCKGGFEAMMMNLEESRVESRRKAAHARESIVRSILRCK